MPMPDSSLFSFLDDPANIAGDLDGLRLRRELEAELHSGGDGVVELQ